MSERFYGNGILSGPVDGPERMRVLYPEAEATPGLTVVHRSSRFRGVVVRIEAGNALVLRSGASGTERVFAMTPGAFSIDGETVSLAPPKPSGPTKPKKTASGSVAVTARGATVAKASRILVEGIHDAELVEKVWGDDLRAEGIVVERLDGIDVLESFIAGFRPTARARLGVLVDHLVDGSKESRIAQRVRHPHVCVTGTPYVDVWQAIKPSTAGIAAWPVIPRGTDWKSGMCAFFGEPEPGLLWKQLLGRVSGYADLEPPLVGAVESLIDFVTDANEGPSGGNRTLR